MQVYIDNLGKYVEGNPKGAWFTLPLDYEEIADKLGLDEDYEEYMVSDTGDFPINLGCGYYTVEELNEMYDKICELPSYIANNLKDFLCYYEELNDLYEKKDKIILYENCNSIEAVAYEMVKDGRYGDISESLLDYIDCERLGNDLETEYDFIKTDEGMCGMPL